MRFRLAIALFAVAIVVSVGAVVAVAAPGAVAGAASPSAGAANEQYCPEGEAARRQDALARFKAHMKPNRAHYFKAHKSHKARTAFVKKQLKQLHKLQRAAASCN